MSWRSRPIKDEDLPLVRAVLVKVECFHCGGEGRMPGRTPEQERNGELVDCPVCGGKRATVEEVSLDQLAKLLAARSPA